MNREEESEYLSTLANPIEEEDKTHEKKY